MQVAGREETASEETASEEEEEDNTCCANRGYGQHRECTCVSVDYY